MKPPPRFARLEGEVLPILFYKNKIVAETGDLRFMPTKILLEPGEGFEPTTYLPVRNISYGASGRI